MEGQVFVGILEDWLRGLTRKSVDQESRGSRSQDTQETSLRPDDFNLFKNWFSLAIRITEVWSGDSPLTPEDVVFDSAVKKTHSRLLHALSMFTDKELLDLFGPERANRIRGITNEVSFDPVSIETIMIRPSADAS